MFVAKPSTLALSVLALGPANTAPRGGGGVEAFVVPSNVGRNIGRLEGGSYVDDGGRRGKGSQQRRPRQRHQEQRMHQASSPSSSFQRNSANEGLFSSELSPRGCSSSIPSPWGRSTSSEYPHHQTSLQVRGSVGDASLTRMAMTTGAKPRPAEFDPSASSKRPSSSSSSASTPATSSSHSHDLDDHRYVAAITDGVRGFLEAMDQSLSGELVTVVTYMPWCRSCHHLRHHLRMDAEAHAIAGSGAMFYEIDLNANPEVHKMLDIHAAPTVLLYSSGQLVDEFTCSGASGPRAMLRHIEEQIGAVPPLRNASPSLRSPPSPTPGTTTDFPGRGKSA